MEGNGAGGLWVGKAKALATEVVCPFILVMAETGVSGPEEGIFSNSRCACGCAIIQDSAMFSVVMAGIILHAQRSAVVLGLYM